ncbi:3648_t:CDS:2 [Gigaspora margarita]|uniref:3648_t:CDS:1 n=1 Tax=Gigaspora margarita TaxID=4874 RepID=A0ABM8W350_GIGMA|nr:3648_t:CDS:2 [Gigaspora margarita]
MTMSYGKYGRSKIGALFSIPLAYPYLKNQITGPDYRIIQCGQIDSLGSWQDQWCAYHQRRIILSWLIIFLWNVYQYQYQKGLFLEWLKKQEKKANQHTDPETIKNVKSDIVDNEINKVEVVTIR